uniref:UDP-N-acetyl-2-amino-2-deoxyglucuronate dehydrogenase n=1 Tax=Candidatus Kentrum sp. MB TaxID=2138164 RepID=A0A450XGD5_9GAMM|nr:MAG: UDP-N-acetyl-2-amino-2-deoxyglucuronate dehydrogenase [Candidatus Kentron sp. MB]
MKKIGLVGCGRISRRHVEAIRETAGVQVALVCDRNEAKGRTLAEEIGVEYVSDYKDIRGMDVVAVLTPSGMHPLHVAEIAEYTDVPHIVCEKPISLTVREAYEVFDRVKAAGKQLHPVYQNRYNPLVVFIKELIDSGRLGRIYQFVCNVFWNRNDAYFNIDWHGTRALDGGVLYTQASHYVDMAHFFFGEIAESKGIGGSLRKLEVFDSVSAVCRFESGVVGAINATVSVYERNFLTEFTLIAEKGTIRLSGTNLNTIDFWHVKGMEKPRLDFTIDHIYGKGHDTMYEYIAQGRWNMFPSREDVLSGIRLMERLSY